MNDKPYIAWNSCTLIEGLPARFATLEEARDYEAVNGAPNRVTHDDGRQWAAWMSGDNGPFDKPSIGFSPTARDWDLPEHGDTCISCGRNRMTARLVYTIVPRVVEGVHPGGRVVAHSFARYFCEEHLPTDSDSLRAHHLEHCGNYPETSPECVYCQR